MTRALILSLALCLVAFQLEAGAVITSRESLIAYCMPRLSAEYVAEANAVEPFATGTDRDGALWTLWLGTGGVWWMTYRKPDTGEHCAVVLGEGWSPADIPKGPGH